MVWAEAYIRTNWHLVPSSRFATIHQRYRQTDRQERQTDSGPIAFGEPFYKGSPNKTIGNEIRVCIDIVSGGPVHYELPMDSVEAGNRIVNPSGLDARVSGQTTFVSGARWRALLVDGRDSFVRVSGAAHRHECFGDLDNCPSGERPRRSHHQQRHRRIYR